MNMKVKMDSAKLHQHVPNIINPYSAMISMLSTLEECKPEKREEQMISCAMDMIKEYVVAHPDQKTDIINALMEES